MFPELLFLLNFASTLFMCGLIWFVQIVHYPGFCTIGLDTFSHYHQHHVRKTTRVVIVLMLIELITSIALVITRPNWISTSIAWTTLSLTIFLWLSTFLVQVPRHNVLLRGFSDSCYQSLCRTNWLRTIAWSARAAILMGCMAIALSNLR